MSYSPYTQAITPPTGSSGGVAETEVPLLQQIVNNTSGTGGSWGVILVNGSAQAYDYQAFEYYGSSNNVKSITYKNGGAGGTTVAVQRFAYLGGGAADDDLVTIISVTSS